MRWRVLAMSEAGKSGGGAAWHSNGTYPASNDSEPNTADLDHRPDVPTPAERIRGIIEKYGDRVFRPMAVEHGRKLRADCLEEPETVSRTVEVGEHEEIEISETARRGSLPWIGGIEQMLEWYEDYRDKHLRMARGSETRGDYESFLVDMDNSLTPKYQSQQYAQIQGMKRQLIGGEYPNGVEVEGEYADPVSLLLSLSATSLEADGSHRPVCEHDRAIREAWSGSSNSVKRTLRYVLEDKMGLSPGEYAWWWQSEPHPGPQKPATGYSHSHPVVVFDRAEVDPEGPDPTDVETYRPVVAKHIEECEGASWSAHRIDETEKSAVSVKEESDISDFAGYVAKYIAVNPDQDLLERSDEYLMWAASQWATTSQKYSRSHWATASVTADRCEQRAMDPETKQERRHGEVVVRASGGSPHEFECSECGSPHGIDQDRESLVSHRLEPSVGVDSPESVAVATDGGTDPDGGENASAGRTLSERWGSARSGGLVSSPTVKREGERLEEPESGGRRTVKMGGGYTYCSACGEREPSGECDADAYKTAGWSERCPLPPEHFGEHTLVHKSGVESGVECELPSEGYRGDGLIPFEYESAPEPEVESVGFDRDPTWSPDAVVKTAADEVTEIGKPGGTAYAEIVVEGAESVVNTSSLPYLPAPDVVAGPEPWTETELFTEAEVRAGEIPPPELVAREIAEITQSGRRVTSKQWGVDWYADRFERESDGGEYELEESEVESVRELVRTKGITSVPSVMGRLGIDPSVVGEVREVVEGE